MMRHTPTLCLLLTTTAWLVGGCEPSDKPASKAAVGSVSSGSTAKLYGQNVLLITLDTTRADRLGCYGYAGAATPTLDELAEQGVLFLHAQSQVPLTFPSHASLMTGRYPKELGVRVNGRNALAPTHPTLATIFKEHGYGTAAFVSAAVVDSRYGLDRGFDTYSDDMGRQGENLDLAPPERPANVVTDDALAWLDSAADKPFFVWIHYYDPHDPYEPPSAFRAAHPDPYDGEIAFMDTQIKRVVDWLNSRRLRDRTLVIAVGDHGESFGEHGELGHTVFLYQTNLSVPMILTHPSLRTGHRVEAVVECVDLLPTVLSLMGWTPPPGLLARDLTPALAGELIDSTESYGESHHVNWSYGWAEQRSLTTQRWKYISSTEPELFDLAADPRERVNVLAGFPKVARQMREALQARFLEMQPGEAGAITIDEGARRELESLGYLSGGTQPSAGGFLTPNLPDPKRMLPVFEQVKQGRAFLAANQLEQAIAVLKQAAQASPGSMSIHFLLGMAYQKSRRPGDAIAALEDALRLDPRYPPALQMMAESLVAVGRREEAARHYRAVLALDDANAGAHGALAQFLRQNGNTDEALHHLQRAIEIDPDNAEALNELGIVYEKQGDLERAADVYRRAVAANPDHAIAQFNLGMLLLRGGHALDAPPHLRQAVVFKPDLARAIVRRAGAFAESGDVDAAEAAFEAVADNTEVALQARFNLAVFAERRGDREAATRAHERVLELEPGYEESVAALVGLYLGRKRSTDAVRMLRAALPTAPNSLTVLRPLASLLATAPNDEARDGQLAVELAERAATLTQRNDAIVLATLAAAYAETGAFDKAVAVGTEAADLARRLKIPELPEFIEVQLAGYRAGRPFRDSSL